MESIGDIATVTVHIKKIREKIEKNSAKPQYIETIWGVGYPVQDVRKSRNRRGNERWRLYLRIPQVLVCRKEAGLAVQSGRVGAPDLVSMLKNRLWEREGKEPYLGVVHRLDQPVEGLLVFAKTKKAAASLSAQVQDGRMVKQYLAVTLPEKEEIPIQGRLEDWLLQDRASNSSRIVPKETRRGQEGCAGVPDPENLERARR